MSPESPKRLALPSPRTCAKYSIEAARNAAALREVAIAAAANGRFGAAVAMEILALEEAAKAQALGMRAMVATLHPNINYPTKRLEDVLQHDHNVRHRFAAWQIVMRELVRLSQGRLHGGVEILEATTAVADQTAWLDKAAALKERGLYVDPHSGTSPAKITKADYDKAVRIVEPYVTVTLQQAGLVPTPEPPPRRRPSAL